MPPSWGSELAQLGVFCPRQGRIAWAGAAQGGALPAARGTRNADGTAREAVDVAHRCVLPFPCLQRRLPVLCRCALPPRHPLKPGAWPSWLCHGPLWPPRPPCLPWPSRLCHGPALPSCPALHASPATPWSFPAPVLSWSAHPLPRGQPPSPRGSWPWHIGLRPPWSPPGGLMVLPVLRLLWSTLSLWANLSWTIRETCRTNREPTTSRPHIDHEPTMRQPRGHQEPPKGSWLTHG